MLFEHRGSSPTIDRRHLLEMSESPFLSQASRDDYARQHAAAVASMEKRADKAATTPGAMGIKAPPLDPAMMMAIANALRAKGLSTKDDMNEIDTFRNHNLDPERTIDFYRRPSDRAYREAEAAKRGLLGDYKALRDHQMQGIPLPKKDPPWY